MLMEDSRYQQQNPTPGGQHELQSETALKNSEQRLADIIDFLPDPTFVIDKEHQVIAWNRAMEDMTGVKAREILGKGNYEHAIPFYGTRKPIIIDLILEPDEEMEKHYSLIIKRDKQVLIVETPALILRGKEVFLWGKASLLYDSQGKIIGAIESIRDITERKQAEMALKNSEQRWADIINFLPDPTFVIDNNHRVIAWNRAMEDMTGVKAEGLLGRGGYLPGEAIYGFRRPVMADLILNPNEEIEKSYSYAELDKNTLIMENVILNLRGKDAFLWGKATLLYDSLGNITGAIESIRDITERKKVENELSRLKKAVECSSNSILLTDKNGLHVSYCNESFSELMGYSGTQINSNGGVREIYNNQDVARDIFKTLTGGNSWQGEVELRTAGNKIVPASFLGDVVRDETGEIIGLFGVYTDITERKQAEIALKNSEQRLADMINFLPDATFVIDKEHKVIAWNRAMEDLSGVKAQEILGLGDYEYAIPFYGTKKPIIIDQILEPDEEIEKHYSVIIERDKEVLIVETPTLMVKGKETYLWGKASPLYDSQGTIIGAIESIRNVTDRKKAELYKLEAQERVARAENLASLGLMTTGLAHAIKQPLNSLMVTIDSILYWYDQGQDLNRKDLIEDLRKALVKASRINEIIEHMRAFIRNERYGELTPINMNLAVENALDILKAQPISDGVQVRLELDPDLPMVLGYENRIEEIIINLLVNAMQSLDRVATNQDKIITCTSTAGSHVVLEIGDNGAGIKPENMDKIFEPFFSTKEGQGTGMGLFITKAMITTLNGNIQCDSNEDRTTFRIELPPYRG